MKTINKTALYLPFYGEWFVFWGGDTKELNAHHAVENQKFAFDFCVIDTTRKRFRGAGKTNEDYYAFGKEVLSPANGIVTDVIDGVRDNIPGSMNSYYLLGNSVFIQHFQDEVSVLAHLKYKSIRVKVGDSVRKGQIIGLCGNSGNSSEPHLHYHLQDTLIIQDGKGIKCYFQNIMVVKNGEKLKKDRHSPVKGDIITP